MKKNTEKISHRETAVSFLQLASSGKVKEAYQLYVGLEFRHHNPFFKGDAETLMTAMEENAAQNPNKILEVQRTLEDGELVAVHSRLRFGPDNLGVSTIHIFCFKDDRIVELWDVGQPVPEESPNENGMF